MGSRSKQRVIDGKRYEMLSSPMHEGKFTKNQAKAMANRLRTAGTNARVIPNVQTKNGVQTIKDYSVFASKKGTNRTYNSHVANHRSVVFYAEQLSRNGRVSSTGRRNWLGRRKRTVADRLNQKEAEDYLDVLQKLRDSGKKDSEATVAAIDFAKQNRLARETEKKNKKARKKKDEELKIAREENTLLTFQDQKLRYEADIPAGEILRYNSLELAGMGTAGLGGYGIAAATGLSAFPVIPIAVGVGFIGAKAVRSNLGNIGLKPGVNWLIDETEDVTKRVAQSLRVSKDNEKYKSSRLKGTLGAIRRPGEKPVDSKEVRMARKAVQKRKKKAN
jgi:hypothetical protein